LANPLERKASTVTAFDMGAIQSDVFIQPR
jgi:hypothetical protein